MHIQEMNVKIEELIINTDTNTDHAVLFSSCLRSLFSPADTPTPHRPNHSYPPVFPPSQELIEIERIKEGCCELIDKR